jgi:hypothetical protein
MDPPGVRLAVQAEGAAPVTIPDGQGRVIRIVPAEEFRRSHSRSHSSPGPTATYPRLRRQRAKTSETEQRAAGSDGGTSAHGRIEGVTGDAVLRRHRAHE